TATVFGTAAYLSPEQARGERVDHRSDIYSLGVVLYEMLTGRPPFRGDSPLAVALKHVSQAPAPPTQLVPSMPASLEAVVLRALAKDPAARYASGSEMAGDLRRAAGSGLPDTEPRTAAADRAAGSTAILSSGTPTEPLA